MEATLNGTGRYPVLLVPGWSNRARAWRRLASFLLSDGWPSNHVHALDFEDPFGSNVRHAAEIAKAVDSLLETTRADRVDIVAHSMGGLATRRYLADHGMRGCVRRVVFLATPHRGTWAALFAFGGGRREMMPGSRFLRELNGRPLHGGVEAAAVWTRLDLRVLPRASAMLEGGRNLLAPLVTHQGLLRNARVHRMVCNMLLEPAPARPAAVGIPEHNRA